MSTSTRVRPMPLDAGTSLDAEASASVETLGLVKVAILGVLAEGPATHDDISRQYNARCLTHPAIPRVTPQRLRTAVAQLVRDGHVAATTLEGRSALGHRATVWAVAHADQHPAELF